MAKPEKKLYEYIDSNSKWQNFRRKCQPNSAIALDTEADSLHSYEEQICLLQISDGKNLATIDTFSSFDINLFFEFLRSREVIIHGADYDLHLFKKTFNYSFKKIFDTQIAARLCGEQKFGLASLVKKVLSIQMPKGCQKANWRDRKSTRLNSSH